MKERRKIKILPFLMALIICVCSYRVPALASTTTDFMIWTTDSAALYDTPEAPYVYTTTDTEASVIYDLVKSKIEAYNIDLSSYDDYVIFSDGSGITDYTRIRFVGLKDCGESFFILSGCTQEDTYASILPLGQGVTNSGADYSNIFCESTGTYDSFWFYYPASHGAGSLTKQGASISTDFTKTVSGLYSFTNSTLKIESTCLFSTMPVYHYREARRGYCPDNIDRCYGWFNNGMSSTGYDLIKQYCVTDYSKLAYGYDGEGYSSYDATAPSYTANNELCFDTFLVEKINHPDMLGGTGARVQYSYGDKLFEAIQNDNDYTMKMHYDVVITYRLVEYENGLLVNSSDSYVDVIYDEVEEDIEFRTVQDGVYLYDVGSVFNEELYNTNPFAYYILNYYGQSDGYGYGTVIAVDKLAGMLDISTDELIEFLGSGFDGATQICIEYFDVAITGRVYDYSDSTIMSNSGWGHTEFISGQNSSYVNTYNSETGESEQGVVTSGNNYYNVVTETDSGGNTYYNYYYYDTTNNTVTPSVGTVANTLMLTFANPLQLQGVNIDNSSNSSSSGGSSGGSGYDIPELIIEDDDYTDVALREDLKDGFGLFDNSETDIKADGYLNMASAFFNNIDPELQGILTFGISSVVVIGILRSVFRR